MRQFMIRHSQTNRQEDKSLDLYLSDISKEKLISVDEEVELASRIREGDQEAFEKLVKSNLRFVVSVAKQYQNQGLSLPDLINEGNLGLLKAALRFDETRGFKFISYAVWWIRQSILQALAEYSRMVRLPYNQVDFLGKISKAKSRLEQKLQREPSFKEISIELEISEKQTIQTTRILNQRVVPIDYSANGECTYLEVLSSSEKETDSSTIEESYKKDIQRVLNTLTKKERDVLDFYFGITDRIPCTLEEVGRKLGGLTRQRTGQIKDDAIFKLKNHRHILYKH